MTFPARQSWRRKRPVLRIESPGNLRCWRRGFIFAGRRVPSIRLRKLHIFRLSGLQDCIYIQRRRRRTISRISAHLFSFRLYRIALLPALPEPVALSQGCLYRIAGAICDPSWRSYESTLDDDHLFGHESGAGMPALPQEGRLSSQAVRSVPHLQVLQAQIQRERGMSLFERRKRIYVYH